MRNKDNDAHSALLDGLQQRIQTERTLLQRRLDVPRPMEDESGDEDGVPRRRRTGRLYRVFLALSVPATES